ncbi:MAG TPA: hypothetical protein VGM09_24245 [Bradyrhizobium sp.]
MADLVQKRQDEPVVVDQAMKGEAAVQPDDPGIAMVDGLGIDGVACGVEFELDFGKGAAQIDKNIFKLIRSFLEQSGIVDHVARQARKQHRTNIRNEAQDFDPCANSSRFQAQVPAKRTLCRTV